MENSATFKNLKKNKNLADSLYSDLIRVKRELSNNRCRLESRPNDHKLVVLVKQQTKNIEALEQVFRLYCPYYKYV